MPEAWETNLVSAEVDAYGLVALNDSFDNIFNVRQMVLESQPRRDGAAMEAPRRPEPSLVGAGGRRRAQPRDGTDYLAVSGAPEQPYTRGTAGTLPSEAAAGARSLEQDSTGISF